MRYCQKCGLNQTTQPLCANCRCPMVEVWRPTLEELSPLLKGVLLVDIQRDEKGFYATYRRITGLD